MFSIGEFSKMTGLTVKTLRFYHQQGILEPSHVESGSGYRLYDESKIETARVILALRHLDFSIADITEILSSHEDDSDIVQFLESRRNEIRKRMKQDRQLVQQLDSIISSEQEAMERMNVESDAVVEKTVEPMLVASIRMTGKYSDCGGGFGKIGRQFGRSISGKAMMLCHDSEYRADDANFEVAMPIKRGESTEDVTVYELAGGRCLSLMHHGPYEELSRSYERILKHAKQAGLNYAIPSREIYHKGPGMIFRGNPKKYLTEIQLMISEE